MKIQLFSTHPQADGVFGGPQNISEASAFQHSPKQLKWLETCFKTTEKKISPCSISSVILQHSVGDVRSHIDLKRCFDTLFKAETFTAAAKLKEYATCNSVDA